MPLLNNRAQQSTGPSPHASRPSFRETLQITLTNPPRNYVNKKQDSPLEIPRLVHLSACELSRRAKSAAGSKLCPPSPSPKNFLRPLHYITPAHDSSYTGETLAAALIAEDRAITAVYPGEVQLKNRVLICISPHVRRWVQYAPRVLWNTLLLAGGRGQGGEEERSRARTSLALLD